MVGGFLITAGVAGELFIQFRASKVETDLRSANHKVEAQLGRDADSAKATAEQERLARIEIEEIVAWRSLSKQQQIEIASRLKPFSGQEALLQYNINDLEAEDFALDIATALQLSIWKVHEPLAMLLASAGPVPLGTNLRLPRGIIVSSTGDQSARDASEAISHELNVRGFDAEKSLRTELRPKSMVFISVEHRPEGPQGEAKLRQQQKIIGNQRRVK
jgi:hypothetical protein